MVVSDREEELKFSVQAGNSKLALCVSKSSVLYRVRVVELVPAMAQVGNCVDSAKHLRHQHDQLILRFNAKRREHQMVGEEMKETAEREWEEVFRFLEARKSLLDQSVSFYAASHQLLRKLQQVESKFKDGSMSADAENAKKDLEKHQNLKKSILEATMATLQEGQSLLEKLRRASMEWGAVGGSSCCHATTSGCYQVEQLLVSLRFKKLHLEELWSKRKAQLEQCVKLMMLKEEVAQLLKWLEERKKDVPHFCSSEEECFKTLPHVSTVEDQLSPLPQRIKYFLSRVDLISSSCEGLQTDAAALKNSLLEVEGEVDLEMSEVEGRKRNLNCLLSFYKAAREAMSRLDGLAVMAQSARNSNNVQAFVDFRGSLFDATVAALREGGLIVARMEKESGEEGLKNVTSQLAMIEEKLAALTLNPQQASTQEHSGDKTLLEIDESIYKLNSWLVLVGQSNLNQHHNFPFILSRANQFLVLHRSLAEEVRVKHLETKEVGVSLETLLKSHKMVQKEEKEEEDEAEKNKRQKDDKEGERLSGSKERCEKVEKQYAELREQLESRSKLALSFVVFFKRERQLQAQCGVLEEETTGVHDERSCLEMSDRENCVKKFTENVEELEKSGKSFIEEAEKVKKVEALGLQGVLSWVEKSVSALARSKGSLNSNFSQWKQFVTATKQTSDKWSKLLGDVRQTIEWTLKVEEEFFTKIAGELGSSQQEVLANQKRLDAFKNTAKKVHDDTETHLKTCECLSLHEECGKEGERELVVSELLRTQGRFQARLSEYQHLLHISNNFFQHFSQLDALISATEQSYQTGELASGVGEAKEAVRAHAGEKEKVRELIEGACKEGGDIVVRVRQEDAEEVAKDEVRRCLQEAERQRAKWQEGWQEHQGRLVEGLVLCRFYFDLKQLQNELDLLQRQLDCRKGSYGTSPSSIQSFLQAFEVLQNLAKEVGVRVDEFGGTAGRMIEEDHYDSRRIRHEVDETQKRWKRFQESLVRVRRDVDEELKFFQINNQCEGWVSEAGHFLLEVSRRAPQCQDGQEVEGLVREVEEFRKVGGGGQDGRLKDMEVIATALHGSVKGPQQMNGLLEQTHATYNAFIRTIEELRGLKGNLANTESILAQVEKVVERGAPKKASFTLPLHNAEVSEGQRFTFECRLECDTLSPHIEWFREEETARGFLPSYHNGLCQLTIEETLLADSATYTCQATTAAGSTKTSATLVVKRVEGRQEAPELLKHLRAAEVPEGTFHTFECCVIGTPTPSTQWFLNDTEVSNGNEYVITNDQGHCSLKIKGLKKELHNGKVNFKATNPQGEAATSATLNVLAVEKPEFTKPLRDAEVEEGRSVRLQCHFRGKPPPRVQWFFNDSPILTSVLFKIEVGAEESSLEAREVFAEDCGTYSVTIGNLAGEAHSSCLIAMVTPQSVAKNYLSREAEKPSFVSALSDKSCKEGEAVCFECFVTGHPSPQISWFHKGKAIKQTKDFNYTFDGQTGRCQLHVHETYAEDSGVYVCQATNACGSDASSALLNVEVLAEQTDRNAGEVPPKFTQLLKDIEATEGEMVRFECRVIGTPAPLIKWFQGRNVIENGAEFKLSSEKELQTLTIGKLHRHDAGNFMVRATNDAGIAKCYATLLVKQRSDSHAMKVRLVESSHSVQTDHPLQSGHAPPEILKSFHDVHCKPGQPCSIEVVISGLPKPKIQWFFNNKAISAGVYIISCLGDVHSLHIPHVTDDNVGRFSVIAENDAGKAWCSALLVVVDSSQLLAETESPPETPQAQNISKTQRVVRKYVPPTILPPSDLPPKFFAELTNTTAQSGQRVVLEVLVEGRPEPLVTWYKNTLDLTANPRYEISCRDGRARLVLLEAGECDSGEYACVANNHLGSSRSSATVSVQAAGVPASLLEGLQGSRTARSGEEVLLEVVVRGHPAPKVTWFRHNMELKPSPDFVVRSSGHQHSLLLAHACAGDSGRYEARVENALAHCTTSTLLTVQPEVAMVAPKFVQPLHNMTVLVDEQVRLECSVPPHPPPESFEWSHNNRPLLSSPSHHISYLPQQGVYLLVIHRARLEDRGRYVCTVVVKGVSKSTAMDLNITAPKPQEQLTAPHFTQALRNQVVDDSSDVILSCSLQAQPAPTVQWLHNGQVLPPSRRHVAKHHNSLCTLAIHACCLDDQGIYTCVARNSQGEQYSSAELKVTLKSPMPPPSHLGSDPSRSREVGGVAELYFKPVFKRMPADLHVPEGHVARFDCIVIGRPTPDVYWFREGVRVAEDWAHKVVINEEGINSIILETVCPSDAGDYLCIARNRAGEDRFNVALNVLPRKAAVPPRFSSRIPSQVCRPGEAATFSVEVEGIPRPSIVWHKNDRPLSHSCKHVISGDGYKTTLHIPVVTSEDDAWYACVASSVTGSSHNKFRFTVEDVDKKTERAPHHLTHSPAPHHFTHYPAPHHLTHFPAPHHLTHSPAPHHLTHSPAPHHLTHSPAPNHLSTISNHPHLPTSPTPLRRSPSPSFQLLSSQKTVSQTTLKTVHRGSVKSVEELVGAPVLVEAMKDQLVAVGARAHFKCRIVSPQEPVQHQWSFQQAPIISLPPKFRIYQEADGLYGLEIEGVEETDAGLYKVTVVNEGGEVTCIAHLKVGVQPSSTVTTRVRATPSPVAFMHPPHVLKPLADQRVLLDDSANFQVLFHGPPLQQVEWLMNDVKVVDGQDEGNITLHQSLNQASMFISCVHPCNIGKISCVATSVNGKIESTATLAIRGLNSPRTSINLSPQQQLQHLHTQQHKHQQHLGIPQQQSQQQHPSNASPQQQPPNFLKRLSDRVARDGTEVVLSCSFEGHPPLRVSWSHNGQCIDHSHDFAINTNHQQGVSELVIVDCMQDDNGVFQCSLQNPHGTDLTQAHLTVTSPNQTRVTLPNQPSHQFSTLFEATDTTLRTISPFHPSSHSPHSTFASGLSATDATQLKAHQTATHQSRK